MAFERGDGDGCFEARGFGDEGPDPEAKGGFGDDVVDVDAGLDHDPDPDPAARLKLPIGDDRPPFGPLADLNTGDVSGEVADGEPRSMFAAFESKLLTFWGRFGPPCTLDLGLSLLVHDMPDSLPPMDGMLPLGTANGDLGD